MGGEGNPGRGIHFGALLLISFVIFTGAYVLDQTFRWSDRFHGFLNGAFHVIFHGVAWCIFLLPWSLLIAVIYRAGTWTRFRTFWVLAPAVAVFVMTISGLITDPPTPQNRFLNTSGVALPADVRELRYHFSGGGIADFSDTYYFECSPAQIDRLISELGMELDPWAARGDRFRSPVSRFPDGPDFSQWEGVQQFRGSDADQHWFYYLITNGEKTKAYINIGCI